MSELAINISEQPNMQAGIFADISNDAYQSLPIISHTGLTYLRKSPAHFQEFLKTPSHATPAKELGSAIHTALLEPELFKKYIIAPKVDKRTKEGKALWNHFLESMTPDQKQISEEDFHVIEGILESVYKHPTASILLKGGKRENTVVWKDPVTGVMCKCRPDLIRDDNVLIDIKSADDASKFAFQRSIIKYNYHTQSTFYLEGYGLHIGKVLSEFIHVVVEKEPPYAIGLYALDDMSLAKGSDTIRELLDVYSVCKQTNVWPAYDVNIQNISIPGFAA